MTVESRRSFAHCDASKSGRKSVSKPRRGTTEQVLAQVEASMGEAARLLADGNAPYARLYRESAREAHELLRRGAGSDEVAAWARGFEHLPGLADEATREREYGARPTPGSAADELRTRLLALQGLVASLRRALP
ncbi:MAG: hypothetical protein QM621_02545 [Aeromicrobium sp.]|uniref:hypothetical protein n=1 Tax=Aeromicrobium sp. TaxID=1871063 RepID=UPI0039E6A016